MSSLSFSKIIDEYLFEELDKQILKRIPYCFLISLLILIIFSFTQSKFEPFLTFFLFLFIVCIEYLGLFIWTTYDLNKRFVNEMNNTYENLNWASFNNNISEIFQGKSLSIPI